MPVLIEAAVESLDDALAAVAGGADRLELCANLDVGGTTPGRALSAEVVDRASVPVLMMIRPRGGSFVYSPEELDGIPTVCGSLREALEGRNRRIRDLIAEVLRGTCDRHGLALPMPVHEAANALLSLGIGLGLQRAVDPSLSVQVLSDVVRVIVGMPVPVPR